MVQSVKELEFAKAYEELLERYNVNLIIIKNSDEYGSYAIPLFKEQGVYCNIHYKPAFEEHDRGYTGMGG
jgi:hypothetical protein